MLQALNPAGAAHAPVQSCALWPSGTYSGAGNIGVNFNNRPITVRGVAGAAVTLFDTQGTGPAFRVCERRDVDQHPQRWELACLDDQSARVQGWPWPLCVARVQG